MFNLVSGFLRERKTRKIAGYVADMLELLAASQGVAGVSIVDDPHCSSSTFRIYATRERDGLFFDRRQLSREEFIVIITDAMGQKR